MRQQPVNLQADWYSAVGWGEPANPNRVSARFIGVPAVTPTYRLLHWITEFTRSVGWGELANPNGKTGA